MFITMLVRISIIWRKTKVVQVKVVTVFSYMDLYVYISYTESYTESIISYTESYTEYIFVYFIY